MYHADTQKVMNRFFPSKMAHPAVMEHITKKMASELAEAHELLRQISMCKSITDAVEMARTFLEVHPHA